MHRAALAVPLLLAAACSGSSPATPEPTATFILPTPDPTTAPPSTTPSATPSPTVSATPPVRAIPAADGDVDGDGKRDLIQPTATVLRITLSSTGKVITAPVHADEPRPPALLGTADIDRDGRAEVFLQTAQGASTEFATPYRFDGTSLKELQLDGGPARLGIGGSVTHGDGFRCLPNGQLEVRQAESSDGTTFTVQATDFRISGVQLVLVSTRSGKGKQGTPSVESAYTADCGTVGD
ncbi:MAG: hypothetical protein JWP14_1543 [Frankiales bacterium]|jgi:hypothetical protein|nr:hypothetical protein [Frankiales bacterium]